MASPEEGNILTWEGFSGAADDIFRKTNDGKVLQDAAEGVVRVFIALWVEKG